jgi:hypothetical protein
MPLSGGASVASTEISLVEKAVVVVEAAKARASALLRVWSNKTLTASALSAAS